MWYKELNLKNYLSGELLELYEIINNDDIFMKIMERFGKTTIYFSEKPIMAMKVDYIRKHYGEKSEREIARELKVSERLVYKIGSSKITLDNLRLFENGE